MFVGVVGCEMSVSVSCIVSGCGLSVYVYFLVYAISVDCEVEEVDVSVGFWCRVKMLPAPENECNSIRNMLSNKKLS